MKNLKFLYFNSTITFITAFIITTIIHESGHFIAYLYFNTNPTMYHNYVSIPDQSLSDYISIIAALAGPVISLLQGIILWILLRFRKNNNDFTLLGLWLCLFGFINFFGYLMLTPLSTEGDTGKVAELLHLPYIYRFLIAFLGLVTIILIVIKVGKWFARFIPDDLDSTTRRKYINVLVMFPIFTGSIINSLLAFPLPSILSIIYPATSTFVILTGYGFILKTKGGFIEKSIPEKRLSVYITAILIFVLVIKFLIHAGLNLS